MMRKLVGILGGVLVIVLVLVLGLAAKTVLTDREPVSVVSEDTASAEAVVDSGLAGAEAVLHEASKGMSSLVAKSADRDSEMYLRGQNEILWKMKSDLVAVVMGAISGVLLMAITLMGFSWFSVTRQYEKDRASLIKQVEDSIASQNSRLEVEVAKSEKRFTSLPVQFVGKDAFDVLRTDVQSKMARIDTVETEFRWSEVMRNFDNEDGVSLLSAVLRGAEVQIDKGGESGTPLGVYSIALGIALSKMATKGMKFVDDYKERCEDVIEELEKVGAMKGGVGTLIRDSFEKVAGNE